MLPSFYKKGYTTSFEWKENEIVVFTPLRDTSWEVIRVKKEEYLEEWYRRMNPLIQDLNTENK